MNKTFWVPLLVARCAGCDHRELQPVHRECPEGQGRIQVNNIDDTLRCGACRRFLRIERHPLACPSGHELAEERFRRARADTLTAYAKLQERRRRDGLDRRRLQEMALDSFMNWLEEFALQLAGPIALLVIQLGRELFEKLEEWLSDQ